MKAAPSRWAGPALVVGGLSWVVTYLSEIGIGLTAGEQAYLDPDPPMTGLFWIWPFTFFTATLLLCTGMLGTAATLWRRAPVLASLALVPASVGAVASLVNVAMLFGITGEVTASDDLGFLGVVGTLASAILNGVAALRARAFARWARLTLALLPLVFVPAILATFPLAQIAPDYVVNDLPFPVVGLVLAAVGLRGLRDRDQQVAAPLPQPA